MHVLIANYHAPYAAQALQYGLDLIRATGARGTLLHIIERPEQRAQGRAQLQAMQQQAQAAGVQAETQLRLGLPGQQIVHLAHEDACNLIVMAAGSKPEVFFGQLLTTPEERVLANAPCPVLVVRGRLQTPRRLLVLHSGPEALRTVPLFLANAGPLVAAAAQVTLLHVMSHMGASHQVSGWELAASADELMRQGSIEGEWLQQAAALFAPYAGLQVTPTVRHGLVLEEIMAEVSQGQHDLIVLGSHGSGGWQDFLIDNVAKHITSQSSIPVLVVPRQR